MNVIVITSDVCWSWRLQTAWFVFDLPARHVVQWLDAAQHSGVARVTLSLEINELETVWMSTLMERPAKFTSVVWHTDLW